MAELTGSRTEFEEGVSIPSSTRFLARAPFREERGKHSPGLCRRLTPAGHAAPRSAIARVDCRRRSGCSWFAQFDDFERRREIDRRLGGVLYCKAARIAGKMAPHGPRRRLGVALRHEVDEQAVLIESA
jgi:hypothetical protein